MENIILFDIDHTLFNTTLYRESQLTTFQNYEEVLDVLSSLKNKGTIGIYSEGEEVHQLKKLTETKLHDHFLSEHLHIFDKKLDHIEEIFKKDAEKNYYLIDDRLIVLAKVKEYNSDVHTIWVRRGKYVDELIEGFSPDLTVKDLHGILEYIK